MNLSARRDSLLASTSAILKASELSKLMSSDEVVGTVTRLVNTPNVMNMIPGETETTVDIRGFSVRSLEEFKGSLTDYCRAVSEGAAIEFSSSELSTMDPATMDIALLEYLQNSLTVKGLSSTRMHSIAWHDIAEVSKYFASSLILLPNPTGVSHSPREAMDLTSFSKLLNAMLEIFGGSHASN
jgi:acetylornithine deacetylase/succinyl-diaminopimelate desuccinylase-like protein